MHEYGYFYMLVYILLAQKQAPPLTKTEVLSLQIKPSHIACVVSTVSHFMKLFLLLLQFKLQAAEGSKYDRLLF